MEQRQAYGNLTLNLSLPLLPQALGRFGESAHPRQDNARQDDASQLISELASHISAGITCPGPVNILLKSYVNSSLANNDGAIVATAIETLAAEFAHRLVEEFPSLLAREIAVANDIRQRSQPDTRQLRPQTEQECAVFLDNFIEGNLAEFYQPRGEFVKDLAKRAASQAREASNELCMFPQYTSGLAKLALYDFIFLCGKPPPPYFLLDGS
jgi:hypothetical protein